MPRTNVYIDRSLCDFEQIEGLPLQLNVSIDKFLELDSRLTGTKLDGGLQQLVLPATKANSIILNNLWELGSSADATKDIIIDVDGQIVFAGKCKPTEVVRSWTQPKQYFLDLYGGNGDPLSQLEGVLLTDIDMGGIATDTSSVTSSWAHNFASAAATATFAPAAYGRPVANNPQKFFLEYEDLRPHITYTHIFEKIFQTYLGYKINSTFYDTEAFRRMHYMYGVGDQWQRNASVSAYSFEYDLNSSGVGTAPVGANKIPFGTVVSDPSSMWDGTNFFFTAPIDGYYEFEWVYNLSGSGIYSIQIYTFGPGLHNLQEWSYSFNGAFAVSNRAKLPPQFYTAGQTFFVVSQAQNTSIEVNSGSYIKGWLNTKGYMGAEIAVESCLHSKPVKDFLRGVFHQFNLTGRFEVITKQFYFEPRLNYFTSSRYGSGVPASYSRTERDGYYKRPLTAIHDWSEKVNPEEIKIKKVYPFGDNLTLAYKKASDAVSKGIREDNGISDDLEGIPPIGGVKYPMSDTTTGQGDKENLNPYFYTLPNVVVNEIQPGAHLPAMFPNNYKFDQPLPEPTFEWNPTCGFYYGVSGSSNDWNYEGTDRTLPMMYQQPPLGGSNFVQYQDCITYNNTGDYMAGNRSANKGLFENYYFNYLQALKHGELVEATVTLTPEEVFTEDFRNMKYFLDNNFILLIIANYNPLTNKALCTFWRYTYGITSDEYNAFENGQSDVYNTLIIK